MGQRQGKTEPTGTRRRTTKRSKSATALTLYLDNLAPSGRRSARSRLRVAADILGHAGALEVVPWTRFGYAELCVVRGRLLSRKPAPSAVNSTLAALRGVLRTAFGLGLIPVDSVLRPDQIKRVTGRRLAAGRSLTPPELGKLPRVCRQDATAAGVRDAAIIMMMAMIGLRRSEVVGLRLEDLDRRRGRLVVREGKGRRQRELVLPPMVRRGLAAWLKVRGRDDGAVFRPVESDGAIKQRALSAQRLYAIVVERALEAGLDHCTPHDLRRTFVTQLLENKIDLNTVRQLAGHSDIGTTARYDRRDQQIQRRALTQPAALCC